MMPQFSFGTTSVSAARLSLHLYYVSKLPLKLRRLVLQASAQLPYLPNASGSVRAEFLPDERTENTRTLTIKAAAS